MKTATQQNHYCVTGHAEPPADSAARLAGRRRETAGVLAPSWIVFSPSTEHNTQEEKANTEHHDLKRDVAPQPEESIKGLMWGEPFKPHRASFRPFVDQVYDP